MTTWARIAGIVRRPRPTFEAVIRAPRWAGVLVIVLLGSFAASAAFLATEAGQLALVDQWERMALAFGQDVDDARYAEFQAMSRQGVQWAAVSATARVLAATVVLAGVLFAVFGRLRPGTARFGQVLAVVTHAGVILLLRDVVSAPVQFARESIANPATLGLFFSMLDEGSPAARFLAMLDLFVAWWLLVLAVGIAALYQRRVRTVAALLLGAYVAIALAIAGVMAALGGTE